MDCSPPGSPVCGILQTRILEWAALPASRGLPGPGTECTPMSPALAGGLFPTTITTAVLFDRVEVPSPPFTVSVTFSQRLNLLELQFPHL